MRHFDLCVIGSGTGNSIIDKRFREWDVALVERSQTFGGTCLNAGCIPTKMFVYPADLARLADDAGRLGVQSAPATLEWAAVRDRVFGRIDPISASGAEWRERPGSNVTLFRDEARFVAPKTLQVGDEAISADHVVIATGSSPRKLDVPGADDPQVAARLHTSEDIMRLPEAPRSLIIIGGGYVAAEFAHVFAACGTKVTILNRSATLLRREDAEIAARFTEVMSERVHVRLRQRVVGFDTGLREGRVVVITNDDDGLEYLFEADEVLLASGRVPNSADLNCAAAGVDVDDDGFVVVDPYQRTTAPGVFALGDVSSKDMLKHVANAEGRVVTHNLLHPDDLKRIDRRFVPHAVFSEPQVASVGLTEQQAIERGTPYVVATKPYADVAYGWAMEDTRHFAKLLADPGSRQLIGAHIIGPQASTLIQPLIQAMTFGLDVPSMARGQYWIHPALTEVVENALLELKLD